MADRPPIALVEWVDSAVVTSSWDDRERVIERAREMLWHMVSVGFLLASDPDSITLALSLNPGVDDVLGVIVIPRASLRRMDLLAGPDRG